jgi:hypothetical protein
MTLHIHHKRLHLHLHDEFEEEEHPRGQPKNEGQFVAKGKGGKTSKAPTTTTKPSTTSSASGNLDKDWKNASPQLNSILTGLDSQLKKGPIKSPLLLGNNLRLDKLPDTYRPLVTATHGFSKQEYNAILQGTTIAYSKQMPDIIRTQAVAGLVFNERASQITKQRGIDITPEQIKDIDDNLWREWMRGSKTPEGLLVQLAVVDELKVPSNLPPDTDAKKLVADAESKYPGGFDTIKALVRAKWETSQLLLEKAGIKNLEVYKGMNLPDADKFPVKSVMAKAEVYGKVPGKPNESVITEVEYKKLDAKIKPRSVMSTSTNLRDAYSFTGYVKGGPGVVMVLDAPNSAALFLPIQRPRIKAKQNDESEVALLGTDYNKSDVWLGKVPSKPGEPLATHYVH